MTTPADYLAMAKRLRDPLCITLPWDAVLAEAVALLEQAAKDAKLAAFGAWALASHREELGDLDGCSIQDKAEELGLLVRVQVNGPCGEACLCVEWDDFPLECLRYSDSTRATIAAMQSEEGKQ